MIRNSWLELLLALQIVGPRLGDEQLLSDVETIDAVLNSK
jgi:hypothetical protein